MSDKLYLVTFACSQVEDFTENSDNDLPLFSTIYCECVTPSPVGSLLATRKQEAERQAKIRRGRQYSLTPREFHIVSVVEVSPHEAEQLSPPKPNYTEMRAMFEQFRPVKPDCVVEEQQ